ncbi:MAG: thioredoxin family protein, partial [Planctomycetes bacterium]|nr:thioredoxin family protein [Planctomycetota bacterium]
MITLTRCALLVLLVCPSVFAVDKAFVPLSFDKACQKAEADGKLVFIDFYTTWCGPCKMMDKSTFTDEGVINWLKENTIALKVDAEKEVELAERFKINSYPTLLFAKADGTEAGRFVGLHQPAEFLSEAAEIKAGKKPLERAKQKLVAAGENDPMARMKYADSLVQAGKPKDALAEYLWCFDEGAKHNISFSGVRLSFLTSNIARLGQTYPPALDALRQRRDLAKAQLLEGEPRKSSFWSFFSGNDPTENPVSEFVSLNKSLDEDGESLKMYDKLRKEHPDWLSVKLLRTRVFRQLLKAKRYQEIAESTNVDRKIEQMRIDDEEFFQSLPKDRREELSKVLRQSLIRDMVKHYEVFVGIDDQVNAARFAKRAIDTDDSASTYNLLAWHAYLSGKPVEINLTQARKANELSDGKNAAIIDTLARVLDALDKNGEACELLKQKVKEFPDGRNSKMLKECEAELGCQ